MQAEKLNIEYYRLSKEDGDVEEGSSEESCSITSQRTCVGRYIRQHFGSDFVTAEIVDDGYSGTNMDRPGMQRLLRLVKAGQVQTIIVRDLSRFARNYLEAGHYLEFVFPMYDVRFISVNDQFDSKALGESTGGLELAIRNLINEMYSKDISRKIKSVVDMKKLNGEYVYGTPPYGYKKGEKKNTIVPDEEAAQVVRQIFSWAAEGITITQIANRLNAGQVTTPSVYLASARGKYPTRKFWTFESVRNILKKRIYTGDTEAFQSHVVKVGSSHVKMIPPEQRQIVSCTHEALISREVYFLAQNTIKSNRKSRPSATQNPMTSLLICGCCGNRLEKGKSQNKNWLCTSARYQTKLGCSQIRINDEKIQQIVLNAIVAQCRLLDAKVRKFDSTGDVRDKRELLQREQQNGRRKIEQMRAKKMKLYEDYVTGALDKKVYIRKKEELSAEIENLKIQMQLVDDKKNILEKEAQEMQEQVENAMQIIPFQDITKLTPELTKTLIKRIVVSPEDCIRIEWNFYNEMAYLTGV